VQFKGHKQPTEIDTHCNSLYIIRIASHRHSITAASTSFKTALPVKKYNTTKLSYRKDDPAMRLYTGDLKIFGSP